LRFIFTHNISTFLAYLALGFGLILTSSCKSKKSISQIDESIKFEVNDIIKKFNHHPEISFFNGKAKTKITDRAGSIKATQYLRIKKDSVIWTAVKKVSVEGGRAQITPDSAYIILRLEKAYQAFSLDELSSKYGIAADFNFIQDITMGIIPVVDSSKLWEIKEDINFVNIKTTAANLLCEFQISKFDGEVYEIKFGNAKGSKGLIKYGDYRPVTANLNLPFKRIYEFSLESGTNLIIDINFSKIEIDDPTIIKFNIPKHYTLFR